MMNADQRLAGTKIRSILEAQGRRQDWLAQQLGVAPATVNRWINGSRGIDIDSLKRVAVILGVPLFVVADIPYGTETVPNDNENAA